MRRTGWRRAVAHAQGRWELALLAALAYLPALASSPGRMPADTKLYLYTDPGALLSDARWSYDAHQYGGWVTHQVVSYLWPSGPWFWTFERLGVPDWVAHRLWIGTLMCAAGLGMAWLARQSGLTRAGALVAALAYQCSPYLLPYVSRTSVMLLPWVGLPWLVGLTRRAVRRAPGPHRWRDPAWCGLVVLTVGGVNLTATAMIVAGPVLWLLHEAVAHEATRRRLAGVTARIGVLTAGASAWWLAAVAVQGRYGGDVLTYSETFRAVTHTASAAETVRGQGYWLAYVDTPAVTTTMARDYQHSPALVALGFVLAGLGMLGLAVVRSPFRRFAAWVVLTGLVLASVAHIAGTASPVARLLADHSRNTIVLGLRSSTRAIPLVLLGLGLGLGSLVQVLAERWRPRLVPVLAGILVVANLPALWTASLVDPANDRSQDIPPGWQEAGDAVDAGSESFRVLQIPGAEFSAHTWGITNEPVLPGLTRRPVLTRDLIPLGSPGLMDTFYALDDRIQAGVFEPASLVPLARLLGADTVVVPLDLDTGRYGTFPPGALAADLDSLVAAPDALTAAGLTLVLANESARVYQLADPLPVVRTKASTVLVVGDGAGVIDAAAAGLITGDEALLSGAALEPAELRAAVAQAGAVVITDQNRLRAHQWRTSQDVVGLTEEPGSPATLRADDGDYRLEVFASALPGSQTVARPTGDVRASATAYGSPVAYRPEDRPANAVDGDLRTSWRVGLGADPAGERILVELPAAQAVTELRLVQPGGLDRRITQVAVSVGGDPHPFDLPTDAEVVSLAGEPVESRVEIRIVATAPIGLGDGVPDAVGFAEISVTGPTGNPLVGDETIVAPTMLDAVDLPAGTPIAVVLTRERVNRPDRQRRDPETHLDRRFSLPDDRTLRIAVTARANDSTPPADTGCRDDLLAIDGAPVPLRVGITTEGEVAAVPCGITAEVALAGGSHTLVTTDTSAEGFTIDRVVLTSGPWPTPTTADPAAVPRRDRTDRRYTVAPCPDGCWFVLGEGRNDGWHAELADGTDLGAPRFVDGGMNGWWLPPSADARQLTVQWRPQRFTDAGLLLTALTAAVCLLLLVVPRRRRRLTGVQPEEGSPPLTVADPRQRTNGSAIVAIGAGVVALLAIGPIYGAVAAAAGLLAWRTRRWALLGAAAAAVPFVVGAAYVARIVVSSPTPGFGWISAFEWGHRPMLLAAVLLAASVTGATRRGGAQPV